MSILSFTNQGLFTGEFDIDGFNVDSFPQGLTSDQQKSALAFDGNIALETDTLVPVSGAFLGGVYTMDIDPGYHGKVFAIIDKDRLSTQFTFNSASEAQTFVEAGYDSVGPEIRRLAALGYV